MSDSNRTKVGMVEEVVPGTTPATPAFENLRVTAVSLAYAKQTATSKELAADRQITDLITLGFQAGGDIPQEASYGAIDSELRGALFSEWVWSSVRANTIASNISAVSATAYTLLASDGTQYKSGVFAQYMMVLSSGFVAAGNNRTVIAGAASSGTSIVITAGVVDAAPAATARVKQIGFQGPSADLVAIAGGIPTQGLTSTLLDFTTMGLDLGEWVYVGGPGAGTAFATAATKGFCRISSVAAHTLLFDIVPAGWAADVGTGKTVQVYTGDYIRNGTTKRSYTVELQYQDIATPEFEYYTGMYINTFEFSINAQSILNTKANFLGFNAVNQTARFAGATDIAAPTNDVMNASANVGFLYENGAPVAGPNFVLGASFSINNQLRRNTAVGSAGTVAVGAGQFKVEGDLNMYYGNNAILQKIRASTASGYAAAVIGPVGTQAYLVDLPRIKYADGNPTVPGIDTDRMLDAKFQALKHATLGYTMSMTRFEAFNV